MKIAILNIFNGVIERGSEIFVDEIALRLSRNHQVSVFQIGEEKDLKYKVYQIKGIPYCLHQQPIFSHKLINFFYTQIYYFWVFVFTLKCLFYLLKERFDWIIPVNGFPQALICRLIRFFCGGKILISGHAGIGVEDKLNILIGKPNIFVALTPLAFSWSKKYCLRRIYIPNGVDLNTFNPKVKPAYIPLKKPIVFCNSALLPYKRVDLVIKAVAYLSAVSLLLIGEGPLEKEITSLGKKLLGERFKLLTNIPHKEIASYYTLANVFTLPSMPVVAPDDLNRRKIIGNGGLYCDVTDIFSYAQTLKKAIKTNFGEKPRRQAEKFSWDIIVRQYEKLLEKS